MTVCETLAANASLELKALVLAEYHNDREVCYNGVADYCNNNGVYTDGSIANVMELIYEGFNGLSVDNAEYSITYNP